MKRFLDSSSQQAKAGALIDLVERNVLSEMRSMGEVLGGFGNAVDFAKLEKNAIASLTSIERLIAEGTIDPSAAVRHSAESRHRPPVDREVRIGVFPTAANPFHWGHLLGGLTAMERFHLDRVIFVIAGRDSRKPEMASENIRHSTAKQLLELFDPLFEYCSIAFSTAISGEENLFRILAMNPDQAIHAYYIVGGDHYHRYNPDTGSPDTIQKLEEGLTSELSGKAEQIHRVSAVFLRREGEEVEIPTFLDVRHVGEPPLHASSTEIRRALGDRSRWRKLCTLPFAGLVSICGNRLYGVGACIELLSELRPLLRNAVDATASLPQSGIETPFCPAQA